ncbi:MAG: PHP domain-containing protein [Spirochaetaceae bacterium]|nr:PHP domain-containing protein [Spirochaetaceae bacterium]
MIDLHTHSSASDGSLSPKDLVEAAKNQGLSALALTDHDTIAGLQAAAERARELDIRFIPGVEFEINWVRYRKVEPLAQLPEEDPAQSLEERPTRGVFHLLGLGLTRPGKEFVEAIEGLVRLREERNFKILDIMDKMDIHGDYEDIKKYAGGNVVGRPHFASFLVEKKLVKNIHQAFDTYLSKGRPLFVPRDALELEKALELIHNAGGKAVLAHPLSLYVSWGRLPGLLREWKDKGLDGIEAWHPTAKERTARRFEELGRSLGLCITAGSDFHGASRPERRLGYTSGNRKIDETFLDELEIG